MSVLDNFAKNLGNFRDNLQTYLNDRLGNIQKKVFSATNSRGETLFSPATQARIGQLMDKYKMEMDPRISKKDINQIRANQLFDRSSLDGDENIFNMQMMDTYKVSLQAKYLKGILGSREPLLPMIFNVIFPETADLLNVTGSDPFFLFVNPSSWSRSNTKVQSNSYVRNGIKTERWGEELEQITANGSIGAFYTQESGLTRTYRRQTPSFRNLMQLVQIYKNNGCIYGTSYEGAEEAPSTNKRILDVGYIEILYGLELFRGTFESFTISEAADKPFTLEYSFVFNVAETISVYDITTSASAIQKVTVGNNVQLVPNQFNVDNNQLARAARNSSRQDFLSTITSRAQETTRLQNANSGGNGKPYQYGQQTSGGTAALVRRMQK